MREITPSYQLRRSQAAVPCHHPSWLTHPPAGQTRMREIITTPLLSRRRQSAANANGIAQAQAVTSKTHVATPCTQPMAPAGLRPRIGIAATHTPAGQNDRRHIQILKRFIRTMTMLTLTFRLMKMQETNTLMSLTDVQALNFQHIHSSRPTSWRHQEAPRRQCRPAHQRAVRRPLHVAGWRVQPQQPRHPHRVAGWEVQP